MTQRWAIVAATTLGVWLAACGGASSDRPVAGRPGSAGGPAGAGGVSAPAESTASAAALPVIFADLPAIQKNLLGRRGRPVFVNFWATWCGPCVEELPQLAALSKDEAARGADFVGISLDAWVTGEGQETETKVRTFMARAGVPYPTLIYRGDQDPLLNGFQLPGPIPYSILYDAHGGVVTKWSGPVPIADLRRALAGLRPPA